jgi:hypothetical protein
MADRRAEVRAHLEREGITVLPVPFDRPDSRAEFTAAVQDGIAKADIFVQLLGATQGQKRAGFESDTYYQLEAAKGKPDLKVMQWLSEEIYLSRNASVSDEWYLNALKAPTVNVRSLPTFIQDVIDAALAPPPRPIRDNYVVISADETDANYARQLNKVAQQENVFAAIIDPDNNNDIIREQYADAHLVTFVFGEANNSWLMSQSNIFRKAAALSGNQGSSRVVYVGPPKEDVELKIAMPNLRTIDCREKWSVEPFRRLLRELFA